MMSLLPTIAAGPALETNPVLPLWMLVPLALAAAGAVIWLYAIQRKLVSPVTALAISFCRLLLVILMAALFLQPAFRWTQTHTSAGTLWILADQSPSMHNADPQADLAERVRWAEGLGRVPASARNHSDYFLADLTAVASGFNTLRPSTGALLGSAKDSELADVAAFVKRLGDWAKEVDSVRRELASDGVIARTGVPDSLDRVVSLAREGASAARSALSLRGADDQVQWAALQTNLQLAQSELAQTAAREEQQFVAEHAGDSAISTAAAGVSNITRGELAWLELTSGEKRGGMAASDLFSRYHVRLAAFADTAQAGGTLTKGNYADTLRAALAAPDAGQGSHGQSTNLAEALRFVADQIPANESGAVIVVSDGRHNGPGDPTEVARLLGARGVRVYGLLTGSHNVSPDAAVEQVDAPDWIYQEDTLRASAMVRLDGLDGKEARVEFLRGDTLLGTKVIKAAGNQLVQRVEFSDKPLGALAFDYKVRVSPMEGEVNKDNNSANFRVAIKKDKLYALFIDDRPRWEYRYLAAYLSRPESMLKPQIVLLSPVFVQGVTAPPPVKASPSNPRVEAQLLPQTRDEWGAFDLIVLGDVPPDQLPIAAQQFIASAVRDKGATLITIAGQKYMPGAYAGTPLAEILPVTLDPQFDANTIARHTKGGFRPGLAPEGAASILGQLAGDSSANSALWSNMPAWYWHSPYTQAKPAASALWSITEAIGNGPAAREPAPTDPNAPAGSLAAARRTALLASLPVGSGKSLYLASDQTWRLRQIYGANSHDRFWGQVLRWAVGSDLPAGGKFVRFGATQQRYTQDQPVVIVARILHEDLTPYAGLQFSAVARPTGKDANGNALPGAAPSPGSPGVEGRFVESTDSPGYYRATLGGLPSGQSEISLKGTEVERLLEVDPSVTQKTLLISVTPTMDLERRNMNTDPAMLARIAQASGGFSIDVNYADVLAAHLPAVEKTQTSVKEAGFFSDPKSPGTFAAHWIFLGLFALLITIEWGLRKAAGLI
jgi:hypothetical protein